MLLGIQGGFITDKYKGKLYKMLTFCASKSIPLNWITVKAFSITLQHKVLLEYVSLDDLSCILDSKDNVFHRTWEPFLPYIGLSTSTLLQTCGMLLYMYVYI